MAKYLDGTGLSTLWSTCKSSFLSTSGGVISGAIKRLYSAASDSPVLNIASVDQDIWIWRVSDSTYATESRYGFGLKYLGTGGGNYNALGLYSDDCTGTQVQVFYLTQDGIAQFNKQVKFVNTSSAPFTVSSSTVISNLNADLLDGKDASAFSLTSHNHDFTYLKLSGGTLTGTLTVSNGSAKVNVANTSYDTSISLYASQNVGIWNEKTSSWILKFDGSWLYRNDKKIWDEGNLTPSDYLPKSGGTITNTSSHYPLTIKGTNEYSSIEFRTNGGVFRKFGIKSDGNLFTTSVSGWQSEYLILHSGNYTDYTVKKDGTGASGTWGINVTGNAKSLSRVDYTPAGETVADYKAALLASTLSSSNGNWTTVPYYFVHRFDQDSESAVGGGWYSMMTIGGYQNTSYNQYLISCHGGLRLGVIERADNEWRPGIRWIAYTSDIPSTMAWSSITDKPESYTPSSHGHTWTEISSKPDTATRWPKFSEVTNIVTQGNALNFISKTNSYEDFWINYAAVGDTAITGTQIKTFHLARGSNSSSYAALKAGSFIKEGGTSNQFLKADGSVDSNSYSTTAHNHDGAYVGRNSDVIPGYIHSSFANNQEYGFIISQAGNANTMKFTAGSSSHNVGLYCPQLGWMCYLPNGATDISQAIFAGTAANANTLGGYSASSFLRSHQSVSGTFWGNSWSNGGSINGTLNGAVSITSGNSTNPLLNITRVGVSGGTDYISMYVTATNRPLVLQMDAGNIGVGVAQPSNKLEVNGNIKADSFIKKGGTSSQFLKADGTVDSNSYSTTSHNHNSSYVSSLGTSGDSLVWTKNGTDNIITVPFSSKTHHIAPRTYSPADNSVGAHKAALVTLISNYQDGFGDCVKVPYYVVQNWDNDSATSGGGGSYLMTKLDGYSGSSYSEYLLSCHALINLGVVGRNGNEWTQIKWLAFKSDNVASASQLYTARTLTIGNTGKTFNGTEDVSWSLSEIGAAASNHNHNGTYLKLDGSSIMSDNLVINFGNTDKFVVFSYTGDINPSTDSWRVGVLGTGFGETNYFTVQYQVANSGSNTWNTAYTIGQSTGTVTFTNNISINGYTNLHTGNHTALSNSEIDNIIV